MKDMTDKQGDEVETMKSTKLWISILLSISVLSALEAQGSAASTTMDDKTHRLLSGVWNFVIGRSYNVMEFSWGLSRVLTDGSVVIDLRAPVPRIYAPQMGELKIEDVKRKNESTYVLRAEWERDDGRFFGTITLELLDTKHMVIYDEMKPYHFFDWSGPRHVLMKVDGPE